MILAIDIGNSNITLGIFQNKKLLKEWRLLTNTKKNIDDYAVDIVEIFLSDKINSLEIEGCIISSVVPILTNKISDAVKKILNDSAAEKVYIVGENKTKIELDIRVNNKNEVGHDRLVNSIGAIGKFGHSLTIIDLGTATTFDVINNNKQYVGGVIFAGINTTIKSLHESTAQLPKISIKPQNNVIGKSTFEAINSGINFGYASLVTGIIEKIEAEIGYKTKRIITGGLSEIFCDQLKDFIDYHEPNLTLEGLNLIYENNNVR